MSNKIFPLEISWDFDAQTKNNLCITQITGNCQYLDLSFSSPGSNFFEINTNSETEISFSDSNNNCAIFFNSAMHPFFWIRNKGDFPVKIIASNETGDFNNFLTGRFNCNFNIKASNYLINKNESIIISRHVSQDGSKYISEAIYPFGFYYKIDACFDEFAMNYVCKNENGKPTYSFECLSGIDYETVFGFDFNQTGSLSLLCCDVKRTNNCYYENNISVYLNGDSTLEISGFTDSDIYSRTGNLKFETWIKPIKIPDSGSTTSIFRFKCVPVCEMYSHCASMFDLLRLDDKGNIWAGNPFPYFYESGKDYILSDFYDGINFILGNYCNQVYCSPYFIFKVDLKLLSGADENKRQTVFSTERFEVFIKNKKINFIDLCCCFFCSNFELDYNCYYSLTIDYFNCAKDFTSSGIMTGSEDILYLCISGCPNISGATKLSYDFYNSGNWYNYFFNVGAYYSVWGNCAELYGDLSHANCQDWRINNGIFTSGDSPFYGRMRCYEFTRMHFTYNWENWDVPLLSETIFNPVHSCVYVFDYRNMEQIFNCCFNIEDELFYLEPINKSLKSCSGIVFNDWNHYCLLIGLTTGDCALASMWINNTLVSSGCFIDFPSCAANCSEIILKISNNLLSEDYIGEIGQTKFEKNFCDGSGVSKIFDLKFDSNECDFLNLKTNYVNTVVPSGSFLNLSFSKNLDVLNKEIIAKSCFGLNSINGLIKINCIELSGLANTFCTINYENFLYTEELNDFKKYCILLNIDYSKQSNINYLYAYSSENAQTKHEIILCNQFDCVVLCNNIQAYSGELNCYYTGNSYSGFLNFCGKDSDKYLLKIITRDCDLIKDLNNGTICQNNLFLPNNVEFPYTYVFDLKNVNNGLETGVSGDWVSENEFLNINKKLFLNYTCFINDSFSGYQQCKQKIYELNFTYDPVNFSTSSIQLKTEQSESEPFTVFYSNQKNSLFYSGLQFKYYPIKSILYNEINYEINDICTGFNFFICDKTGFIEFPIQGFNFYNFKLINCYSIIEKIKYSNFIINFNDLCYCFCCENTNYLNFKFFNIKNNDLCYEKYPSITLRSQTESLIQNNLNFYIDPFICVGCDSKYELNNLIYFIHSLNTSGIATKVNYTGYCYGSTDYNFFMIQLKDEFLNTCCINMSGTGYFLIDQRISFSKPDFKNPLPYKSSNSIGYNYIVPIKTGIQFHNEFFGISGYDCEILSCSGIFNKKSNQILFKGGGESFCCFSDSSGQITGSGNYYVDNSALLIQDDFFSFNISDKDMCYVSGTRNFCLKNSYQYSGVQPISISFNYPLLCMENLINEDLTNYCYDCYKNSGIYYYLYNIGNCQNKLLKFVSPEGTLISKINWKTICTDCSIGIGQYQNNSAIQDNVGLINFELSGVLSCNTYCYNVGVLCANINVIGDL